MAGRLSDRTNIVLALDPPASAFRAFRVASAMLALMGFAAVAAIVGQSLHAPLQAARIDMILAAAIVVLLIVAPLSWFAINAIRPALLLPIVGLALWPLVAYYQYVERVGGRFGPDLLYSAVIPNMPIAFVLWAGIRGLWLAPPERAVTRTLEPGAGYVTVLRSLFGVWPGLIRSPVQAVMSGVLIYLSQVIQGLALVLIGAVVLLAPGEISRAPGDAWMLILIALVIAAILVLGSAGLRNLGRIVSRQSLEKQIKRDRRPSILFLRAFADDQAMLPRGRLLQRFLRAEFGRRRLDHVLVEEFSRFGPVVALGRPGQTTLPFGAARLYVPHDDWQAKVLELAERSAHIVLVADDGAGVEWEIETMLSPALRTKTIFLATERLRDLRDSNRLQTMATSPAARSARVVGAFQTGDGRSVVLTLHQPSPEAYVVALQAFFRRDCLALA